MLKIILDALAVITFIVLIIKLICEFNDLTKEINRLKKENEELKNEINIKINMNDDLDISKYVHNYKIETIDNETIIKIMFIRNSNYNKNNDNYEDLYEFLAHLNNKFDNKEITVIINSGDVIYNNDGFAKHYNFNNINLKISTLCVFSSRSGEFRRKLDYNQFSHILFSNNFKSIDYYSYKDKSNIKYRI